MRVHVASEKQGLRINKAKAKVMVSAKIQQVVAITSEEAPLEQFESFVYLGSTLIHCRL